MSDHHILTRDQHHFGWDRQIPPAIIVSPGDTVEFDALDAGCGQITPTSTADILMEMDSDRVNPAYGPVAVQGARPGDALKIRVEAIDIADWGWTANIPGFGLLADRFEDPALHIWKLNPKTLAPAEFSPGIRVPLKPFPGILGIAPADPGVHQAITPLRTGGNLDTRDVSVGSELLLPIAVPGALFSVGDGHAAQGDGEICGTAIETPIKVTLRFDLLKDARMRFPCFTTTGPVSRHLDEKGYEVTMGVGRDLMTCAKIAVNEMVDRIARRLGIAPVAAYMLCSVCADLRISEIVDQPHWVVSCYFPRVVGE
jgi:acetamidase/formamidase